MVKTAMPSTAEISKYMVKKGCSFEEAIEALGTPIQKSSDPALLEKCLDRDDQSGSNAAYLELRRREKEERDQIKKEAIETLDSISEWFEHEMKTTVRKAGEDRYALQNRIWVENMDKYEQYQTAMRVLTGGL